MGPVLISVSWMSKEIAKARQSDVSMTDETEILALLWRDYGILYHRIQASLHQTRLVSLASQEILKDFPHSLPSPLKEQYEKSMTELIEAFLGTQVTKDGLMAVRLPKTMAEKNMGFSHAALGLFMENALARRGEHPEEKATVPRIDFEHLLQTQQLVMLFAFIDAFLADAVRVICKAKPEVLKKDSKTITWERVVSSKDLEELKNELVETFAYDLGWRRNVSGRLDFLRSQFGLTLDCSQVDIASLEKLEKVRDIAVHNGGRVSHEFVQRTGERQLLIGQVYPVAATDIEHLSIFARQLCGSIFAEVSVKFLGRKESEVTGVLAKLSSSTRKGPP
jgi:hypothetical protein